MVELEHLTDMCISILSQKLSRMPNRDIDLGEWLHWFAFDVITSITFSNCLGFMEREEDISSIIDAIGGRLFYNSAVGRRLGSTNSSSVVPSQRHWQVRSRHSHG